LFSFLVALLSLCLWAPGGLGFSGALNTPHAITDLPFFHHGESAGGPGRLKRYACDPEVVLPGAEVFYALDVKSPGLLSAGFFGHEGQRPLHLHLLSDLRLNEDGMASGCLAGGEGGLELEVQPGRYFLVLDSLSRDEKRRPYKLRVDLIPEGKWWERPVAQGVTLRTHRSRDESGKRQTLNVLLVDLNTDGVKARVLHQEGCRATSQMGREAGAVAAINAGFFGEACQSVSLIKVGGELKATNRKDRSAFGITQEGKPAIKMVLAGEDWKEAAEAVGGVPRILSKGQVDLRTLEEGSFQGFEQTAHPRSAVGILPGGQLILLAADGRTAAGAGLTLDATARVLAEQGATEALNLDGGGSTTLWIAEMPFSGVVNHPSDNGRADHDGQRPVSSALAIFAPPLFPKPKWNKPVDTLWVPKGESTKMEVVVHGVLDLPTQVTVEDGGHGGTVKVEKIGLNHFLIEVDGPPNSDAWKKRGEHPLKIILGAGSQGTQTHSVMLKRKEGPAKAGPLSALGCSCGQQRATHRGGTGAAALLAWMWLFIRLRRRTPWTPSPRRRRPRPEKMHSPRG
jgi:hypothetical protein